jgi:pterin-4a-carbinolamine dehydratase
MEGDNQRRRALARKARKEGRAPSEAGVTLGASKQPEHEERAHREGPPPAGPHKPVPTQPIGGTPPRPGPSWPRWRPAVVGLRAENPTWLRYRELVSEIGRRVDLDFDHARLATEATTTVVARALDKDNRRRFLDGVPMELHDDYAINVPYDPQDLSGFVNQVSRIVHREPDQARYQAQAVLSTMAEQDHDLIDSIELPDYVRDLIVAPPTGGGLVAGPTEQPAALSDDEIREALARLPQWSGDRRALTRTIELPPGNLDRVLQRLARLRQEIGRAPKIGRQTDRIANLAVRTTSVNAVTRLDVELAHRVDDAIVEAGAGMA